MPITTTRTRDTAEIAIDQAKCTGCGLCVSVCKDFSLEIENQKARKSSNPAFGCFGCGHCMAICPTGAIQIKGRELHPGDLFELTSNGNSPNYDQLFALFLSRRSIREFVDRPVEPEVVDKILNAASTSPMGLPPSDVTYWFWAASKPQGSSPSIFAST